MKRSAVFLLVVVACSRGGTSALRVSTVAMRQALTLQKPGDSLAPGVGVIRCASGEAYELALDLSVDEFSAEIPACGDALFALAADRAPRADESATVAAFRGIAPFAAVRGTVDVVIPTVPVGELWIRNVHAACNLSVTRDGVEVAQQAALATDQTVSFVLPQAFYSVTCGEVSAPRVEVPFAERASLTLTPQQLPVLAPPAMKLIGPSAVFAGRTHVFDASASVQETGRSVRTFAWQKNGAVVCGSGPICRIDVAVGDAAFQLSVTGTADNGQSDTQSLSVSVVMPPPATERAYIIGNGSNQLGAMQPMSNGSLVFLAANGAPATGASEISSEPPPPWTVFDTPVAGTCTVTFAPGPSGCNGVFAIAATSPTAYAQDVVCDTGELTLDNPALSRIHVRLQDDGCFGFDFRALGNVDVLFEVDGARTVSAEQPGDGLFITTGGNIWLKINGSMLMTTSTGGASGLPPLANFPLPGHHARPLIWLDGGAGKRVQVTGALRIEPQGTPAPTGETHTVLIGPTTRAVSANSDVVLAGQIDISGSNNSFAYKGSSLIAQGRHVYLPAFMGVQLNGSMGYDYMSGEPGLGGTLIMAAENAASPAQIERIYLASTSSDPISLSAHGGDAPSFSLRPGGDGGRVLIRTGKEDGSGGGHGSVVVMGGAMLSAGSSATTGGNGLADAFRLSMACGSACSALLDFDVVSEGGQAALSSAQPISAGNGGTAEILLTSLGDGPSFVELGPLLMGEGGFELEGGDCSDAPSAYSYNGRAGNAGTLRIAQTGTGAPARPRDASMQIATRVLAAGGTCETLQVGATPVTELRGGAGGRLHLAQSGFTAAQMVMRDLGVDLSGGLGAGLSASPSFVVGGGAGGVFAVSGPQSEVTLSNVGVLLMGATGRIESGSQVQGGAGGSFAVAASGFVADAASSMALGGGDAAEVPNGTVQSLAPGSGGAFGVNAAAASWPSAFSQCVYPTGGTPAAPGSAHDTGSPAAVVTASTIPCP